MEYAVLNDIKFEYNDECKYKNDYIKILYDLKKKSFEEGKKELRRLVCEDLFFIVYFVLKIQISNKPFVVNMCQEVENGPRTDTIDIWPRYHFKSTILTISENIQKTMQNPEHCACIFSYKKGAAERFLQSIRSAFETDFLKMLFPDILFDNPWKESPSWGLEKGITVKRKNTTRGERTISTSGLVEGMLQGFHFERLYFDDVETDDMKDSKEQLDKCLSKYLMALNLKTGSEHDLKRIIGTFYSHFGVLVRLLEMKYDDGSPLYNYRQRCVTVDGTLDGEGVLLDKKEIKRLFIELTEPVFYSQMMCDPTPRFSVELEPNLLIEKESDKIPSDISKFMIVDPAGSRIVSNKTRDYWAVHVIGVSKKSDNIGNLNIYILDSYIDQTNESDIVYILNTMYWRNSFIDVFSYEKNGGVTPGWVLHFINTLQARGVLLSEESKNIITLSHQNKEKKQRILSSLRLPLINGKIHYSSSIDKRYIDHLKEEMLRYPVWHDDGLDALSYIYQVLDKYGFRWRLSSDKDYSELMNINFNNTNPYGWMAS